MKCVNIWKRCRLSGPILSNDQFMLQNDIQAKDSFNMQDEPMYFNLTEHEKFTDSFIFHNVTNFEETKIC